MDEVEVELEPTPGQRDKESFELEPSPRNAASRARRGLLLFGGFALLAGTGTAAAYMYRELGGAQRDVAELTEKNRSLNDALELHRAGKNELDTRLTSCLGALDSEKETAADSSAQRDEAEAALSACQTSMSDLEAQRAQADALLKEFRVLTGRFQNMIDTGQLDVEFRRGQMIVKLPAQVLFPSASATLSEPGRKAIRAVAAVLKTVPGRKFTVAGHTDNLPVRGGEFANNWALSTARALNVTLELIDAGVRSRNLVAAGYGQYAPISRNKTEAGRRRNRRIEIILEPDLRPIAHAQAQAHR